MNPAVKAKWVAALRSGEYKQGRGMLHPTKDTFCCLGVLCDLYGKETGKGRWGDYFPTKSRFFVRSAEGEMSEVAALPKAVEQWADLPDITIKINGAEGTLIFLNDSLRATFAQIADAIEAQL